MEGAQPIYKAPQYPLFYTFCCTKETMRCTFTPHLDYFYENQ